MRNARLLPRIGLLSGNIVKFIDSMFNENDLVNTATIKYAIKFDLFDRVTLVVYARPSPLRP